jgi:hypothetical protein
MKMLRHSPHLHPALTFREKFIGKVNHPPDISRFEIGCMFFPHNHRDITGKTVNHNNVLILIIKSGFYISLCKITEFTHCRLLLPVHLRFYPDIFTLNPYLFHALLIFHDLTNRQIRIINLITFNLYNPIVK